jgi:quinolinate synthase
MNPEAQVLYEEMKASLGKLVPDVELYYKSEIAVEINRLKKERNAVILGHNYMEPVLFHSIPDFKGDSLDLSRKAATTDKDVIVFCGVKFMAETAKILNPSKTVLLPAEKAGCSLAESITAEDVRALKRKYPGVPVVTYVNTYADVKAESDICCTSGNAGCGGRIAQKRYDYLPARPVPGLERRQRNWQTHHIPVHQPGGG